MLLTKKEKEKKIKLLNCSPVNELSHDLKRRGIKLATIKRQKKKNISCHCNDVGFSFALQVRVLSVLFFFFASRCKDDALYKVNG